jgi:hypothetical protein
VTKKVAAKKAPWNAPVLPAGTVESSFSRGDVKFVAAPGRR